MNKHIITLLLVCSTYASAAMPADGISTPLITNESGEVVQRVEYLPTGETFIEQQDTCRGYVGIQGTAKELISLGKFFQEYNKAKGNSMKIYFQIPNNSNYGNNEKANSNIGQ